MKFREGEPISIGSHRPKDTSIRRCGRGQTIGVLLPVMAVLIGAMALCADFGVILYNWMILRKAADAAALAGASYLLPPTSGTTTLPSPVINGACSWGTQAQNVACSYALQDQARSTDISGIYTPALNPPPGLPSGVDTVEVVLNRSDVPVFFLRTLTSANSYEVGATAIATAPTAVNSIRNGLFPAAMPANPNSGALTYGTIFQLTGSYSLGNWGWLNIPPNSTGGSSAATAPQGSDSGSSNLANNIQYGCTCNATVGQWFDTETGVSNGPVTTAMGSLGVTSNANPLPTTLTGNEPQLVTVPVVAWSTQTDGAVQILGFAELWLVSFNITSSNEYLTVQFVQYVSRYATGGDGPNNYGAESPAALVD